MNVRAPERHTGWMAISPKHSEPPEISRGWTDESKQRGANLLLSVCIPRKISRISHSKMLFQMPEGSLFWHALSMTLMATPQHQWLILMKCIRQNIISQYQQVPKKQNEIITECIYMFQWVVEIVPDGRNASEGDAKEFRPVPRHRAPKLE